MKAGIRFTCFMALKLQATAVRRFVGWDVFPLCYQGGFDGNRPIGDGNRYTVLL